MITSFIRALGATLLFVPGTLGAQAASVSSQHSEIVIGMMDHGIRKPFRGPPPLGSAYWEGEEERGTGDVQLAWRSKPLRRVLQPRLTAKLQLNTGGRTSFVSAGAEWRQHFIDDRLYGQVGIGISLHDGYLRSQDPFEAGITASEAQRRYAIYSRRTAFGSPVLFNPNLSLGLRINQRWAVELAYEHYSHRRLFATQNPGSNMLGVRLVYGLGR